MDLDQLMTQLRMLGRDPQRLRFTPELTQAYNQAMLARAASTPQLLGAIPAFNQGIVDDANPVSQIYRDVARLPTTTPAQAPLTIPTPTQNLGFPMIDPKHPWTWLEHKKVSG